MLSRFVIAAALSLLVIAAIVWPRPLPRELVIASLIAVLGLYVLVVQAWRHVNRNEQLDARRRGNWQAAFVALTIVSVPLYFWKHRSSAAA